MRRTLSVYAIAAAAAVVSLTSSSAFAQTDFQWRGRLGATQSIEIKGINGDVRASEATGTDVEVIARRRARRSNPNDVRIEVVPHSGGVTICAVYPTPSGREANRCEAGTGGRMDTRDNDTNVEFEVRVPYGVGFVGRTVNGSVDGRGLTGSAEGHTVNGSVNIATSGVAVATTVNGGITATMGRADWAGEALFKTVNGGITLTLPSVLSADLRASTLNGSIASDFPITTEGRITQQRMRGRIGNGGYELDLSTVNGSIKLLKGQ